MIAHDDHVKVVDFGIS
ncbi:UNVERIFIED_CONTAM: hypothetical protein GTU68_060107, partial [Idotea baltica]|nr:hypothetical protein [Idotea baltica]